MGEFQRKRPDPGRKEDQGQGYQSPKGRGGRHRQSDHPHRVRCHLHFRGNIYLLFPPDSKHRIVTNNSLENDSQAPAPLNLPFGKLFFGYRCVEYVSPDSDKKGKSKAQGSQDGTNSQDWGGGQKLGRGAWKPSGVTGAGGASIPVIQSRSGKSPDDQVEEREKTRSPSPDWGVDDDEMIDYDSD